MNYRHAFHAGNFADVVKHVALALALARLNQKPAPWRYVDSHAGIGLYDLHGDEGSRNPEWREGVGRVWSAEANAPADVREALAPWLDCVRALNPDGRLRHYPGSPAIAQHLARNDDALRLCELHQPSADLLADAMGRDVRVKIELRDGFEALPAYLPPPERRGLVLIDPPFEDGTAARRLDYERTLKAITRAVKRWPGGSYMLWRPIKDIDQVEEFDGEVATFLIEDAGVAPEKLVVADLWVREIGDGPGLSGAGLVLINPPFGVEQGLRAAMPWLCDLMAQGDGAGWRVTSASEVEEDDEGFEEDED